MQQLGNCHNELNEWANIVQEEGSSCGSVGRAVASDTRGLRFESSHRQKFIYTLNICLLSTVYWKDENKGKEAGNGPFLKNKKATKYSIISSLNWMAD